MIKRFSAVTAVVLFAVCSVFAFQFSPLEQTFSPTGADSQKTFTIVNDSNDSIAVVITALVRDQTETGEELNTDASRYFSISPSKVVVPANSSQYVRVQYRGPSTVTSELSFRLGAEQVNYSLGRQESQQNMFNFLYIYTTAVYVAPAQVVSRLDITSLKPVIDEEGNKKMEVTMVNSGNVHQVTIGMSVTITDPKGKQITLSGTDQLPGVAGINILAKKKLVVLIPWPEELEFPEDLSGSYKAAISFE